MDKEGKDDVFLRARKCLLNKFEYMDRRELVFSKGGRKVVVARLFTIHSPKPQNPTTFNIKHQSPWSQVVS